MLSIISIFGTAQQYAYSDMLLAISTSTSETMVYVEYRDDTSTAALITLEDPLVQFLVLRPPAQPAIVYKLTAIQEQTWQEFIKAQTNVSQTTHYEKSKLHLFGDNMEQFDGLSCYDEGVHSRYRKIRTAITTTVVNFLAQQPITPWQIMDLGCGEGQALTEVAIALQQQSRITFNGIGIDLFAQNITHARQQNTLTQLQFTNESFFNFARCLQALPQTPQQTPTMIISSGGLSNAILQDHELLYLLQLAYQHQIAYLVLASIRSVHVPTPLLQRVGYDVTYHNFPNLQYPISVAQQYLR